MKEQLDKESLIEHPPYVNFMDSSERSIYDALGKAGEAVPQTEQARKVHAFFRVLALCHRWGDAHPCCFGKKCGMLVRVLRCDLPKLFLC